MFDGAGVKTFHPTAPRRPPYCSLFFVLALLVFAPASTVFASPRMDTGTPKLASARVWPAPDYTRVTLESSAPLRSQLLTLKNPERLVLDLQDIALTPMLAALADKIGGNDPYIRTVRIARFKPGTIRLVFDLKTEVAPQIFLLRPVGAYGHRLVLDIYPAHPADPLLALFKPQAEPPKPALSAAPPQPAPAAATPAPQVAAAATPVPAAPFAGDEAAEMPQAVAAAPPAPGPAPLAEAARSAALDAGRNDKRRAGKSRQPSQRLIVIAIDAGHGGEDPGAHGRGGTLEKNVTLAIARLLKTMIDDQPNMRGVLTRDGDYFVPLGLRVSKARKVYADLFVSIHADAFIQPDARGSSVFALSEHGASSSAAKWLAKKENEADLIGGVNLDVKDMYLKMTLTDLSFTAQINDSLKLGKAVLSELGDINTLHHGDVEQAGFAVLKAPDIPSILVETAFISNPSEEKKLKDDDYQKKMAGAVLAGIKRYFANNPPLARGPLAAN